MMKTDLNYCIVLSSEQLTYLAGSKYGIDRMKILHLLIEAAVLKETEYAIKGFSTTLQVGKAVLSEVDLSSKLGYDKKTISRVLDKMNQLGIVVSTQSNRTSIHTLKCISAWMQNRSRIDNPFYVRLKDQQNDKESMSAISDEGKQPSPSSFPLRKRRAFKALSCHEIWTISFSKDNRQERSRLVCCYQLLMCMGRLYNYIRRGLLFITWRWAVQSLMTVIISSSHASSVCNSQPLGTG